MAKGWGQFHRNIMPFFFTQMVLHTALNYMNIRANNTDVLFCWPQMYFCHWYLYLILSIKQTAWLNQKSLPEICRSAPWRNLNTVVRFYLSVNQSFQIMGIMKPFPPKNLMSECISCQPAQWTTNWLCLFINLYI